MCDYSLTDNPAESDMPTEAEPWQPVDVSEFEEKMQKLSTTPVEPKVEAAPSSPPAPQEMEADFSEPEEVSLKGPLVSTASALPAFTPPVPESTSAAPSASSEALPAESTPKPQGPPEIKAPPAAKAPPAGAEAQMSELMKLRPFLRFGADIDSDVAKASFTPPARSSSLPKSSLKQRSKSRASSRAPSCTISRACQASDTEEVSKVSAKAGRG